TRFTRVNAKWIILLWLALASWVMFIHKCCYHRALGVAFKPGADDEKEADHLGGRISPKCALKVGYSKTRTHVRGLSTSAAGRFPSKIGAEETVNADTRCELHLRAFERRVAFYVLVFGNIGAGMTVTLTLVILGRSPYTPLWLGYCVMACVDGATETEPSILL